MNILPKKRWHVRNRENIARVRADEAKAAEEEKQRQERIKLAEREARRELLLKKSRISRGLPTTDDAPAKTDDEKSEDHVNFFKDLEDNVAETKGTNKEHEKRVKEEKEKYEKQIGYLTYLGQDTNEALGKKNWYDVLPDRSDTKVEVNLKSKVREDPLELMKKHLVVNQPSSSKQSDSAKSSGAGEVMDQKNRHSDSDDESRHKRKKKKKHKRKKKKISSSDESDSESELEEKKGKQRKLEMLRAERIRREREERRRTEELLAQVYGTDKKGEKEDQKSFKPRYNSQFNPELAKQNYK
ncbi:unnamed protein product [Acanthoscelides obtectus]|uniref:CBF1-interacting co-repressor CIR N-terminal domain-containing protein n=1 Tax=Acanthoscelides obtectus TaxID=200917 RepID=A0A9P0PPU3_ACAOB|nr:unnamed protein product [Acanthoscelides obtectus]CAK1653275.1 Leukocyte receptor cluster member 1 [Acanthoscelides obtectus]